MTAVYYRYAIVALCALVLFLLNRLYFHDEIALEISKELAVALGAGLVISFLLETASREELKTAVKEEIRTHLRSIEGVAADIRSDTSKIETDAFKRAFRRNIPLPVFDTLQKQVLNSLFSRSEHQADWALSLVEHDGEPRIKASVYTSFVLKNLTDTEQTFVPRFSIDNRGKMLGETAKILSISIDQKPGDINLFKPKPAPFDADALYEYEAQVVPKDGKIEISNEFEFLRYMNDHEMWSTLYASDGMRLHILFPDECEIEHFKVEPLGQLNVKQESRPNSVVITVREPVLPGQGVIFYWRFRLKRSPAEIATQKRGAIADKQIEMSQPLSQ